MLCGDIVMHNHLADGIRRRLQVKGGSHGLSVHRQEIRLMRLASVRVDGVATWGVVEGDAVTTAAMLELTDRWPSMLDLVRAGDDGLASVRERAAGASGSIDISGVELLAPIPRPPQNPVAVGLNYRAHADESSVATGITEQLAYPMLFTKAASSVIGPNASIRIDPRLTREVDWEVELAVIIGTAGSDIAAGDAFEHVFGYTVANDVSARDLQFRDSKLPQFYQGKSLDTFCPMGPWIVTRDDLDITDLRLRLCVNGELMQDGSTSQLIFGVPELLAEISRSRTLEPGEIILTGTPAGVGFSRTPPRFLQPGDVVDAEIEGIGSLRNDVVAVGDWSATQ
jgi:2-keto-4-pentenoate hydratase/2-oxohepta-3-ene-1,7-dioic acid hydratase in catechol pathway